MVFVPPARHLLRAKDLADRHYFEPLGVDDLAQAAGLSRAHFSREFRRAFGESPHAYLLTRRLERAAALLRNTDRSVAEVCLEEVSVAVAVMGFAPSAPLRVIVAVQVPLPASVAATPLTVTFATAMSSAAVPVTVTLVCFVNELLAGDVIEIVGAWASGL